MLIAYRRVRRRHEKYDEKTPLDGDLMRNIQAEVFSHAAGLP